MLVDCYPQQSVALPCPCIACYKLPPLLLLLVMEARDANDVGWLARNDARYDCTSASSGDSGLPLTPFPHRLLLPALPRVLLLPCRHWLPTRTSAACEVEGWDELLNACMVSSSNLKGSMRTECNCLTACS